MPREDLEDSTSKAILYEGANQSQLAMLFGMNREDVRRKTATVPAVGKRNGYPIWKIKDVAPKLAKIPEDVVERVLRMNHMDLPKMLAKEYWYAQNQRLNYEQRIGDLWPTAAVIELAAEAFKSLRLSLLLLSDSVEREAGLTEQQRNILTRLVDAALDEIRTRLVDDLEQHKRSRAERKADEPGDDPDLRDEPGDDPDL